MALYDEIKQHFHIPHAFRDWEQYRNALTDYLIDCTDSFSVPLYFSHSMTENQIKPSLLVIGAGACNDLDLSRLISHFSKITLLDNDRQALESALTSYHLEHCNEIDLSIASLNGLTDTDYTLFCEQLSEFLRMQNLTGESCTMKTFDDYACSLLKHCLLKCSTHTIPLPEKSYDFVWCFGVHSQLQSMFSYIYHAFEMNLQKMYPDFTKSHETQFENMLKIENDRFIPFFHDAILRCARQKVFIGLEASRYQDVNVPLPVSPDNSTPIEGSHQGILDIRRRNLKLQESSIIWPFYAAKNLYYQMQIEEITLP